MTSVDWKVLSKQYQRPGGAGASHVYAISNKQLVDEIAVRGGGSRDEKEKKEEDMPHHEQQWDCEDESQHAPV